MQPHVLIEIRAGAQALAADCDDLADALNYVAELADDVNGDLGLGYARGSDSYGVLYKACETAVRDAFRSREAMEGDAD